MTQPAQPGQDANAGAITPPAPAAETPQQIAADGASARLRADAGLPAGDHTRETGPPKEPTADARLRESTPGFETVPTGAREVNSSARAIDNMGTSGPVRVREATYSTADGHTLTGSVYPKGSSEVFMSNTGQKYTVGKNDNGEVSLQPLKGGAAIAVNDNGRGQGQRGSGQPGDQKPVNANPNTAAVAAERAAAQQAQQQATIQAQQRAERFQDGHDRPPGAFKPEKPGEGPPQRPWEQKPEKGGSDPNRPDKPWSDPNRPDKPWSDPNRPDKPWSDPNRPDKPWMQKGEPPASDRGPVIGSGSGDNRGAGRERGRDAEEKAAEAREQATLKADAAPKPDAPQPSIKEGDPPQHPQIVQAIEKVVDRQLDRLMAKATDKPEDKSLEAASAANAHPNPLGLPGNQPSLRPDVNLSLKVDLKPDGKADAKIGINIDGIKIDAKLGGKPDLMVDGKSVLKGDLAVNGPGHDLVSPVVHGLDPLTLATHSADGSSVAGSPSLGSPLDGSTAGKIALDANGKPIADGLATAGMKAAELAILAAGDKSLADKSLAGNLDSKTLVSKGDAALHGEGQLDGKAIIEGKSAALGEVSAIFADMISKHDEIGKADALDKTDSLAGKLEDGKKAGDVRNKLEDGKKPGDTAGGALLAGLGRELKPGSLIENTREVANSKTLTAIDIAANAELKDRQADLTDQEGMIGKEKTDATTLSAFDKDELEEKERKKKLADDAEEDTSTRRNAMIAAMLNDKKKQEAIEKEEQLALNDSKKKGEDKRRRYVVKEKDTLESIAKKQLRDIRLAALIYEINKHMLPLRMEKGKQVAEPRAGTSIWLPSDSDIRDFRGRLYSTAPAGQASSPSVTRGGAPSRSVTPQEELSEKFGQNWEGAPASSAISAGLMGAAVAKSQVRQSNIEKVLGPLVGSKIPEGGRIRYIVRLSDTIDGVAIKHPALKDIGLWPLLARLNDLSEDVDSGGRPIAELRRGMVLDIPSPYEIEAFRSSAQTDDEMSPDAEITGASAIADNMLGSFQPDTDDDDAPTVQLSPVPAADSPSRVDLRQAALKHALLQSGQETVPMQSVTAPLQQPIPNQANIAPPVIPPAQDPASVPLPTSLFQSYQAGQPTVPLKPIDRPTPGSASAQQVAGNASSAGPGTPSADDSLAWQGGQAESSQQDATRVMPAATPPPAPMQAPVVSTPPQPQTAPLPVRPAEPQTIGGWQKSTSSNMPALPPMPSQPAAEQAVPRPQAASPPQGLPPVPLQPAQISQPPAQPQTNSQPMQQFQPQTNSQPMQQFQPQTNSQPMPQFQPQPNSPTVPQQQPQTNSQPMPTIKPVNRPTAAEIMKRAPIVVGDRFLWELDRSVRLVKSAVRWDPAIGVFRSQLEVLYGGTWYPVIFYEVFPHGAVRHEYVGGGKRKSVKMDLPPSAVQELADNDLVNNWQAYCQRFVTQLIAPKS